MYEYQEYPKWVEFTGNIEKLDPKTIREDILDKDKKPTGKIRIIVNSEDDLLYLDDDERKEAIKKDLKEKYDMDIDLRRYKGAAGLGSLEAYYKAVQVESKKK